jgi:hypothetical protein
VEVDARGFTVEPLSSHARCTPESVAAHMLYENADPFLMREPGGTLDTSKALYSALDERRVRVTGSQFHPADTYTIKLEGSALAGYQTLSIAGIRDPGVLDNIGAWQDALCSVVTDGVGRVLRLSPTSYSLQIRCYGWNAVLGELDPEERPPREVGVVLIVTARDQATAHKIAKYANPYLLHKPLPGATDLPSYAFMSSPAEIDRGPIYEFVLNHTVEVATPAELTSTTIWETS